jgi:hypothetical protein
VVVGIVADVGDPAHRLGVDLGGHRLVEPGRRPPRRSLAQHLGKRLGVVHEPPVQLLERQVDDPVVEVVADHLDHERPEQRGDRLLPEPRHQHRLDELGDVVVADLGQPDPGDLGDLVDDPACVVGPGQPGPHPLGDPRCRHPLPDDRLLQEVLPEELLQAVAERVLALGHQGGVRDRQPEGVLEERGHREPVGDRPHHRGLGGGVDEAEEATLALTHGEGVHHRREHQQRDRHGAHPPQPAAAYLVGSGVGRDHRDGTHRGDCPLPPAG